MTERTGEALHASAYAVANGLLMMEPRVTQEALEGVVADVAAMAKYAGIDADRLRRDLETNNNVHVSGYSVIDDRDYRAWIKGARERRKFEFWDRYRTW